MPRVNIPGVDAPVNFPDSWSAEQITAAIENDILKKRPAAAAPSARESGSQFVQQSSAGGPVGALVNAAKGLTFGFADELAGLANAMPLISTQGIAFPRDRGAAYEQGRDYLRGIGEQYKKEYPVMAPVADVSGSLLWGGPAKMVAGAFGPAAGVAGRIGKAMGIGGTLGAVSGAGEAETLADIPAEAGKGAAFGALTSGVLEPLTMGARGAWNAAASNLPQFMQRFTGNAAREAAQGRVASAITQDQRTIPQVVNRMQTLGEEARVADAAGASTRDLLDTMATLPGQTREKALAAVRARRATMPQRLDVLATELNQGKRAVPTFEQLQQQKEAAAKPLYAAVENQIVPITPKLESLMQRPAFREAFDQAVTNAANRGEHLPLLEDLTKVAPAAGVKVRFWDDVKRGLDDVIAAKKRGLDVIAPSNKNRAQSTLQSSLDIKHELVSEIDDLTKGAYKAARDAYAGPAALQSAILEGKDVLKLGAQDIRESLSKLSKSEQEAFRIGAGEALREKVGTPTGQAQMLNAWKDRALREKLQAIYGDQKSYHKALSTLLKEERLRRLESSVGGGSQTARRTAGIEDLNLGVVSDAAQAAKSPSVSNLLTTARNIYTKMATPEPVRNEIGRILLQGGPSGRNEVMSLEQMIRDLQKRNANQEAFTGLLGSFAGR